MGPPWLEEVQDEVGLTPAERRMVEVAHVHGDSAQVNQVRVLAQVVLSKKLQQVANDVSGASMALQKVLKESTGKVIESNEELAAQSRESARALNRATWILAGATVALVFVTLAQVFTP